LALRDNAIKPLLAAAQWEWKEVVRGLDGLQQVDANFQGRRFLFRSQNDRYVVPK
jgi:hypothetical protein